MSDTLTVQTDTADGESLTVLQWSQPSIANGEYSLTAAQTISGGTGEDAISDSFQAELYFAVSGPRFSLPGSTVVGQFPLTNADGDFFNSLPHVVLNSATLPWQRAGATTGTPANPVPWLALLTLNAQDPTPVSGTVADLIGPPSNTVSYQNLTTLELGQTSADACVYIDLDIDRFTSLVPPVEDLPYLCHVRSLSTAALQAKPLPGQGDAPPGTVSVVMSNRIPLSGAVNTCVLVSVEDLDTLTTAAAGAKYVRLAVLYAWNFCCSGDTANFGTLVGGLNTQPDSTLFVPPQDASSPAATAMQMGYVALPHAMRQGANSVSWYRGPLLPFVNGTMVETPLPSADGALAYDPDTGMFDVSLAAAWQLGQLLALNDQSFATALYDLRRQMKLAKAARHEQATLLQHCGLLPSAPEAAAEPLSVRLLREAIFPVLSRLVNGGSPS
jgi:hypothetical protein